MELSTLLTDPAIQLVVGLLFLLAIACGLVIGAIMSAAEDLAQ